MPSVMASVVSEMRTESRSPSRFAGRRVHCIGIGGSGMSGLARMLLDSGAIVSGSEPRPNTQTFELMRRGVRISRTQSGELLSRDIDLVVRTAAIPQDNGEFLAAAALRLPQVKYAELLGQVMAERFGVAVAGTHGKSTTTAMIAFILLSCGADPSFVVGGTVPQLGGGSHSGKGSVFVAEACEFDRSFHNLRPRVACITNIEEDHLDCYRDINDIIASFQHFASLVPADGLLLVNGDDPHVVSALRGAQAPVQTVSLNHSADWRVDIRGEERGCYRGQLIYKDHPVAELRPAIPGLHNLFNGAMALAACASCGIDPGSAADALSQFTGVDRRMTEVGRFNGAVVVDDYGHHPTEIRATLGALKAKYRPDRLVCVFQPHQHSRTRFLLEDFAASFESADLAILPDIYFVRDSESEKSRVSSADLVERIKQHGRSALHLPRFEQIVEHLRNDTRPGDLIVTMGAGNVWEIGRDLVH